MDKGLLKIEELQEELLKFQKNIEEIEKKQIEIKKEQDNINKLEDKKRIIDKCKNTKKLKLKIIKELILGLPFVFLIPFLILHIMNLIPTIQSSNIYLLFITSGLLVLSENELGKAFYNIGDYKKRKKYLKDNDEESINEKIQLYKQRQIGRKFSLQELQKQKDDNQNRINVIELQIQQIEQIRSDVIDNYLKNNSELDNILNTKNYEVDEKNKNIEYLKK